MKSLKLIITLFHCMLMVKKKLIMNAVNKTNDQWTQYLWVYCMKVLMWINNWWTQCLCVNNVWNCWYKLTIDEYNAYLWILYESVELTIDECILFIVWYTDQELLCS